MRGDCNTRESNSDNQSSTEHTRLDYFTNSGERRQKNIKIESRLLLSTVVEGYEEKVGRELTKEDVELIGGKSSLPIRFWEWKPTIIQKDRKENNQEVQYSQASTNKVGIWKSGDELDLSAVGLKEAVSDSDLQGFTPIRGKGEINGNLATLRMVAKAYGTPCPVDVLEKTLEGAVRRSGSISLQGMGQLTELMGLQTQVGKVRHDRLHRLELPVLTKYKGKYVLLTEVNKKNIIIADPENGWVKIKTEAAISQLGDEVEVVLLKKLEDTSKTFGWSWFAPVIKRFQWPLVQVLMASLFIQLFQLANPLLIQQIIDKVINQSNLSALQVLGAALVTSALFQGLLTAVRTWLLIDTTDRMDLVLESVIDKLLRLP